jgi:hypothetical protein
VASEANPSEFGYSGLFLGKEPTRQLHLIRTRNSYQTRSPAVRNYCTPRFETLKADEPDADEAMGKPRLFSVSMAFSTILA